MVDDAHVRAGISSGTCGGVSGRPTSDDDHIVGHGSDGVSVIFAWSKNVVMMCFIITIFRACFKTRSEGEMKTGLNDVSANRAAFSSAPASPRLGALGYAEECAQ